MKIVIATGGSGGHIFPALQTACVLRDRGHEVIFVGVLGLAQEKINTQGFQTFIIDAKGLNNKSLIGLLGFSVLMLQATGQAAKLLKKIGPDKVIGFGSYGSFAVVLSAGLLNIPTMIHEQNVMPGKANRLLTKLVKKIAISFSETHNYLHSKKTILTGCPCYHRTPSDSREVLLKKFSLDPTRKTILVLGGSQGSQKLNEVFFEMMFSLGKQNFVQAIHMTGIKEFSLYANKHHNNSLPVKVFDFINFIEEAYAVSDLVIARAGATTVTELGFWGIPSILVPYPLADGHQKYNADILVKGGLAKVIEQKNLTPKILINSVQSILEGAIKHKVLFKDDPALKLAMALENL